MKDKIIAGDTLDFDVTLPDFPPVDGWTLKYRLVPRAAGGTAIDIVATDDGTKYLVQEAPATTAAWIAGEYGWSSWVEKAGARYTVDSGLVVLVADPALLPAGTDTRSPARRALESVEAAIEALSKDAVQAYTITTGSGSRSVTKRDVPQLLTLRERLRAEVADEEAARGVAANLGINPRNIGVRFNRV
jgi:hypothetical protein